MNIERLYALARAEIETRNNIWDRLRRNRGSIANNNLPLSAKFTQKQKNDTETHYKIKLFQNSEEAVRRKETVTMFQNQVISRKFAANQLSKNFRKRFDEANYSNQYKNNLTTERLKGFRTMLKSFIGHETSPKAGPFKIFLAKVKFTGQEAQSSEVNILDQLIISSSHAHLSSIILFYLYKLPIDYWSVNNWSKRKG